jgi:hypothetical protein
LFGETLLTGLYDVRSDALRRHLMTSMRSFQTAAPVPVDARSMRDFEYTLLEDRLVLSSRLT